jgi:Fe-S cluster biogenesis protein NfuA
MAAQNLRVVGDRIEQLLDELHATAEPGTCALAQELLRLVTELYGGGLERVVVLAREDAPELVDRLLADELVASLLLVHGLHPESVTARVEQALESVRPFLATHDGDVELLDVDEDVGAVHLRLLGSCDGCPSSAVTLRDAVERAIVEAAPEITDIDVEPTSAETPRPPPVTGTPVILTRKPGLRFESCPTGVAAR